MGVSIDMRRLLATAIISLLFISIAALAAAENNAAVAASVLISNAERLRSFVVCRSSVIANSTNTTALGEVWEKILNLTAQGDMYLNASKTLYAQGNYTAAKIDAIWAIRSYGMALSLQAQLAPLAGNSFSECAAALSPSFNGTRMFNRTRLMNMTPIYVNKTGRTQALEIKIKIMKARVLSLLNTTAAANDTQLQEVLDKALSLLNNAEKSLEEGDIAGALIYVKEAQRLLMLAHERLKVDAIHFMIERARRTGLQINITPLNVTSTNASKVFHQLMNMIEHRQIHEYNHSMKPVVITPSHVEKPWSNATMPLPKPVLPGSFNMTHHEGWGHNEGHHKG